MFTDADAEYPLGEIEQPDYESKLIILATREGEIKTRCDEVEDVCYHIEIHTMARDIDGYWLQSGECVVLSAEDCKALVAILEKAGDLRGFAE